MIYATIKIVINQSIKKEIFLMKNFKMILSLATLIACGNMYALTEQEKKEFNSAIIAVENKSVLTQDQKDIIKKYINIQEDPAVQAGIVRLKRAKLDPDVFMNEEGIQEPMQEVTTQQPEIAAPKRGRGALLGKQPVSAQTTVTQTPKPQEVVTPTEQPAIAAPKRGRGALLGGKQPTPAQITVTQIPKPQEVVTPTEQPAIAAPKRGRGALLGGKQPVTPTATPTTTQPSIFEKSAAGKTAEADIWAGGYKEPKEYVPVGVPAFGGWEAELTKKQAFAEAANIFYNITKNILKVDGIRKYINMVRAAYPNIPTETLKGKTYDNAAAILQEVRNEKILDRTISDQLLQMIYGIIDAQTRQNPSKLSEQLSETKTPENQPTLSTYEKSIADVIYDKNNQSLNEKGIKAYFNSFKETHPNITNESLGRETYGEARNILQKVRNEEPLDKIIDDQLYAIIGEIVGLEAIKKVETKPSKEISDLPPLSEIKTPKEALNFLSLNSYTNLQDFVDKTIKHEIAFWYNNEIQSEWFDLAIQEMEKLGYKNKTKLKNELKEKAQGILRTILKVSVLKNQDFDLIDNEVEKAINRSTLSIPTQPTIVTTKLQTEPEKALDTIKKDLNNAKNNKAQMNILKTSTIQNPNALIYQDSLQISWFALAKIIIAKNIKNTSNAIANLSNLAVEILKEVMKTKQLSNTISDAIPNMANSVFLQF